MDTNLLDFGVSQQTDPYDALRRSLISIPSGDRPLFLRLDPH